MWKDLNDAEYRRHFYMRERSYASEPGSRIALKLDDEKEKKVSHELGLTTDDEDEDDDTIECDVGIRTSTLSEPLDFGRRSQTLLEVVSLFNWRTPSHFTLFAHESCAPGSKVIRPPSNLLPTSSWAGTHLNILQKQARFIVYMRYV